MSRIEPLPMRLRAPVQGFPKGWYRVADAGEVLPDALLPVSWLNEQFIVFRAADGQAQVADAFCPHMGAHLASHDGCLRNGRIVCPFHKWEFDAAGGTLAHIPYSALPPGEVGLAMHPTRELDGMVLMWYHPHGTAPEFEPFETPLSRNQDGWVLYGVKEWITTCPMRDMLENLFDGPHIVYLHNGGGAPELKSLARTPYGMRVDYASDPSQTDAGVTGFRSDFTGITMNAQIFEGTAFTTQFYNTFTPIDDERFVLHSRLHIKDSGSAEINEAIGKAFTDRFMFEVEQDLKVLDYKRHLVKPRLCAGDGPIHQYRKYAAEFFVTDPA